MLHWIVRRTKHNYYQSADSNDQLRNEDLAHGFNRVGAVGLMVSVNVQIVNVILAPNQIKRRLNPAAIPRQGVSQPQ